MFKSRKLSGGAKRRKSNRRSMRTSQRTRRNRNKRSRINAQVRLRQNQQARREMETLQPIDVAEPDVDTLAETVTQVREAIKKGRSVSVPQILTLLAAASAVAKDSGEGWRGEAQAVNPMAL